mmetsp:Transcript_15369/g.33217  ORF Transcript_15369/g.33217 Transcript_15369/m.33217 type:complete len:206 (+) Transcript_15369:2317-2934(+)
MLEIRVGGVEIHELLQVAHALLVQVHALAVHVACKHQAEEQQPQRAQQHCHGHRLAGVLVQLGEQRQRRRRKSTGERLGRRRGSGLVSAGLLQVVPKNVWAGEDEVAIVLHTHGGQEACSLHQLQRLALGGANAAGGQTELLSGGGGHADAQPPLWPRVHVIAALLAGEGGAPLINQVPLVVVRLEELLVPCGAGPHGTMTLHSG